MLKQAHDAGVKAALDKFAWALPPGAISALHAATDYASAHPHAAGAAMGGLVGGATGLISGQGHAGRDALIGAGLGAGAGHIQSTHGLNTLTPEEYANLSNKAAGLDLEALRLLSAPVLTGAMSGALSGSYTAGEGHRGQGALRGALGGGAGGGAGGLLGSLGGLHLGIPGTAGLAGSVLGGAAGGGLAGHTAREPDSKKKKK